MGYYASYRGDPIALPLVGALGRVAARALPGLAKKAVGAAGRLLGGGGARTIATTAVGAAAGAVVTGSGSSYGGTAVVPYVPGPAPVGAGRGIGLPGRSRINPLAILPGGKPFITTEGGGCPRGFHLNKATNRVTGEPEGTYCVRNRSMNIGNGRALKRAIRRTKSFLKSYRRIAAQAGYRRSGCAKCKGGRKR